MKTHFMPSDVLNMTFISPGLSSRDISFSIADDHMGSDHSPSKFHLTSHSKRNTPLTEPRYRFEKTDDDLLHNTLKEDSLNPVRIGGGGGVFHRVQGFLQITLKVIKVHSRNFVTFPKI